MSSLFSSPPPPQIVQLPPPAQTPPTAGATSVVNPGQAAGQAMGSGLGQASTILTSGLGDPSTPNVAKKMLLGA